MKDFLSKYIDFWLPTLVVVIVVAALLMIIGIAITVSRPISGKELEQIMNESSCVRNSISKLAYISSTQDLVITSADVMRVRNFCKSLHKVVQ